MSQQKISVIKHWYEKAGSVAPDDFEWLMEQVDTLKQIQKVMGLSHADCFNESEAIEEIKNILNYY